MSTKRESAAVIGVGAAACVACCAGPIIGLLAALGIGSVVSVLLFGTIGLVAAVVVAAIWLQRRRRRRRVPVAETVAVSLSSVRSG